MALRTEEWLFGKLQGASTMQDSILGPLLQLWYRHFNDHLKCLCFNSKLLENCQYFVNIHNM